MKLVTPEISWHIKEPVYSVDFHRNGPNWRFATAGADNDVRVSVTIVTSCVVYTRSIFITDVESDL